LVFGLLEVVDEFLVLSSIFNREFKFAFLGPEDDRLPFHAADHVEGSFGLTAQSHLQQIFFDAGFDGFAQLGGDFKIAVRRTEAFDALMRPLVIVIADPEANALPSRIEALELSAGEKLLPEGFPEALDFAEGHGMVRPALEVVNAVLFHLGLEAGDPAPVDILPAVVGEHLPGRLKLARRDAENFQHVLGRVAAEHIGSDQEAGVVVHETDEVGVAATEPEGEDVRLPHLVGSGALEKARAHQVAPRLGRRLDQPLGFEGLANGLRAGSQEEHPAEQLRDALDAARRFLLLELEDLLAHRLGQPGLGSFHGLALESFLSLEPITPYPLVHCGAAHAHLLGHHLLSEALFQVELHRAQSLFKGPRRIFSRRSPPRGG
jgi:hypothetical protein